jgi:hypothetical protein
LHLYFHHPYQLHHHETSLSSYAFSRHSVIPENAGINYYLSSRTLSRSIARELVRDLRRLPGSTTTLSSRTNVRDLMRDLISSRMRAAETQSTNHKDKLVFNNDCKTNPS